MLKTIIEFLEFIFSISPFLVSLVVWTILAITFSKSIKKHAKTYYWIFGILGFAFALPIILRVCGLNFPYSISSVPIIGKISSELSDAAYFIHPVLVIIMAMGAFSPRNRYINRLMGIRKELSIIVGFPLLAHLAKRLLHTFPKAWSYFANYEESITNPKVVSELGSNISNAVYVLGVVMTVLFIILWVTSFSSVRRKMGQKRWKSTQRWSYALYAMLFIHSVGIQLGSSISYNASQRIKQETTTSVSDLDDKTLEATKATPTKSGHGHGPKGFSFSDIEVTRSQKAYINIIIYIFVYGSYLFFRLHKAKEDKARKAARLT